MGYFSLLIVLLLFLFYVFSFVVLYLCLLFVCLLILFFTVVLCLRYFVGCVVCCDCISLLFSLRVVCRLLFCWYLMLLFV